MRYYYFYYFQKILLETNIDTFKVMSYNIYLIISVIDLFITFNNEF